MKENLSQRKLLEILTSEIEILQQTSKNIKSISPEIAKQLNELKTARLKVDLKTDKLEELLENHKRQLKKFMVIPKWFLWMIVGVLLISVANWFI